jgi:hypothetical protein
MQAAEATPITTAGVLLAALASLQALLTALGVANGGISAVEINNRTLFTLSVVAVLVAVVAGVLAQLLQTKRAKGAVASAKAQRAQWIRARLLWIGVVALALGLSGTSYAAITTPSLESDPTVAITLDNGAVPQLRVSVSASGVPRKDTVEIAVARLKIGHDGLFVAVKPALYHAELGPKSDGSVSTTFSIPVPPPSKRYSTIDVDAWTKGDRRVCGFVAPQAKEPGSAQGPSLPTVQTTRLQNEGCAFVRLAGTHPPPPS